MFSHRTLFLAFVCIFRLTLAVSNPANGVFSLELAATDDQLSKTRVAGPGMIRRGIESSLKSTTIGTPSRAGTAGLLATNPTAPGIEPQRLETPWRSRIRSQLSMMRHTS